MAKTADQIREESRARKWLRDAPPESGQAIPKPAEAVQPPQANGTLPTVDSSHHVEHSLEKRRPVAFKVTPGPGWREVSERGISDIHRTPPHAADIELAFIGAMFQTPKVGIPEAKTLVSAGFFYVPAHRLFFELLTDYFDEHGEVEFFTFQEHIRALGHLEKLGGPGFLTGLKGGNYPVGSIAYYAELLRDKFARRELIKSHTEIVRMAYDESEEPADIAEVAHRSNALIASLAHPHKSTLTVRTLNELVQMTFDEKDNYFGDRVMAAGQACTLLGPGGIGKSRLSMQLAVCMITGRAFLDMATRGRGMKWLFVQSENNNRRLHYDLKNMVTALALTPDEVMAVNAGLFIHTLENDLDSFLNLINPQNYAAVHALIQDVKPDFVQWDPLNCLTDNDLNSDMDMRAVVSAISRITRQGDPNRVPFVLHHSLTGKVGAARAVGWDKASYGRNSKVLQAWTRAQINLAPRAADDPNVLIMSCGKNNNGKAFPEIGVLFDEEAGIYVKDASFDPEEFREEVGINPGHFKARYAKEMLLDELSVLDGIKPPVLKRMMDAKYGMSKTHFYRFARELEDKKQLVEKDGEWFKNVPKS